MKNRKLLLVVLMALQSAFFACKKNEKLAANDNDLHNGKDTVTEGTGPDTNYLADNAKSDEFDVLDTTKWSRNLWYPSSDTILAFKKENVTVAAGQASLIMKTEDFGGFHHTGGCLKSKFDVGGDTYIEIKAKTIARAANVCAAIWLSDEPTAVNTPNPEIDIQETKEAATSPNKIITSLLSWPIPFPAPDVFNTHQGNTAYTLTTATNHGLDEDFHTYGLERHNGKLRFFIDSQQYWEWSPDPSSPTYMDDQKMLTQPRKVIFSIEGHAGSPVNAQLPAPFVIEYVHVYNYN